MERMQQQRERPKQRGVFSPFDGPAPRPKRTKAQPRDSQVATPQLALALFPKPDSHEAHEAR